MHDACGCSGARRTPRTRYMQALWYEPWPATRTLECLNGLPACCSPHGLHHHVAFALVVGVLCRTPLEAKENSSAARFSM